MMNLLIIPCSFQLMQVILLMEAENLPECHRLLKPTITWSLWPAVYNLNNFHASKFSGYVAHDACFFVFFFSTTFYKVSEIANVLSHCSRHSVYHCIIYKYELPTIFHTRG
ncbi:hypothetical protein AAZX31_05G051300 [Glycine max]|nr:hypothetical protein GLYMA_05G053250v4 [Glycine max]KAH1132922.1 hypothetical protein GYH30_011656 [Glycine max]